MSSQEKEKNQDDGRIDIIEFLMDYLRIARRMWAWFLIFAILGTGFFYIRARIQYTPMYTASATFTINIRTEQGSGESDSATYFDNSAAEQMATTFPYILTSGVLKNKVAADMGQWVSGNISASVVPNTNLLTISVTDTDAGTAYATLQSVVKNYPSVSEVIIGKTNMEMLDETGIPPYPDNPQNFGRAALKGAVLGVAIVACWAVLLVFTRRTIRKEEDVYTRLNTRCLGAIPEIVKKRRSKEIEYPKILLTDEKNEEKLQEPLRIIRNKIEYYATHYGHKTFLITSAIAGEGKSTVAVNLALSLAQTGKKVALLDCDLRHPSDHAVFGVEEAKGLSDVLRGQYKMRDCILYAKNLGLGDRMKLLFLPGGKAQEDGSELLGTKHMQKIIELSRNWAEYVILDSAPAGILTDAVVLAQYADAAVFVVRKDFARVDYIMDGMEHLSESHVQIIGGILNGV